MQQQKMQQMHAGGVKRLGPAPGQRAKGERKPRDSVKSPSIRKPKDIHYIRLRMVQQYFRGVELKDGDKEDAAAPELA